MQKDADKYNQGMQKMNTYAHRYKQGINNLSWKHGEVVFKVRKSLCPKETENNTRESMREMNEKITQALKK